VVNIRAFIKLALLLLTSSFLILTALPSWGQGRIEVTDVTSPAQTTQQPRRTYQPHVGRRYSQGEPAPESGRDAAAKYMAPSNGTTSRRPAGTDSDRYLAIHFGPFLTDNAYKWGARDRVGDAGNWTAGLTYRLGGWDRTADFAARVDLSTYDLPEGGATKISLVPLILFPDASSKFPLYFGGGVGLGIMAKQIASESPLNLEYQLLAGVRFFELAGSAGFFVETGIKNHLNIFSDGQFNGIFIALGSVFTF
jgi:hypothetical protein